MFTFFFQYILNIIYFFCEQPFFDVFVYSFAFFFVIAAFRMVSK